MLGSYAIKFMLIITFISQTQAEMGEILMIEIEFHVTF
jgi:hypothetical protein